MCGRFGLANPHRLRAAGVDETDELADALLSTPRYNIAPTQPVVVARTLTLNRGPERRVDVVRWGLIPSWARDPKIGNALANARAETVTQKASVRGSWEKKRRGLVYADVFYEWQNTSAAADDPRNGDAPGTPPTGVTPRPVARTAKAPKRPFAIRMRDGQPFAFAGLWDVWRDPEAARDDPAGWVPSCTLITTSPNSLMRGVHDRMPVILPPDCYNVWLDPHTPLDEARALLAPYGADAMRACPVSTLVNRPGNDVVDVLAPL